MAYPPDPVELRGRGKSPRPIVRVDNTLIFPNGTSRKMTFRERWKWYRGKFIILRLSDGERTEFI